MRGKALGRARRLKRVQQIYMLLWAEYHTLYGDAWEHNEMCALKDELGFWPQYEVSTLNCVIADAGQLDWSLRDIL